MSNGLNIASREQTSEAQEETEDLFTKSNEHFLPGETREMSFRTIAIVLICFNLFTDCSRAGKFNRSVHSNKDASGENPVTENEPQTEMSQSDPSYGKMNDKDVAKLTKTKSGEGDAGTKEGVQGEENGKEKRALPAVAMSVLKNPKVQEAVIEKGIEVAGKLVDKQLKIIDEAQEKAENFLKKEIKLDIEPDKSWASDSMYVPAGYHFQSSITDEAAASSKEAPDAPFVYPAGIGSVMMNGCYGKNYSRTDPCYNSRAKATNCWNQIDGAAFLGVGFDGRGKYSPESRKMSIVQRNCANKATYDDFDVPDTMNVHGIYDTSASQYTFQGKEEYSTFLKQEAGVSGSVVGFYAGVKEAWGSSSAETKDSFLSLLDVDIERYEIFMDEVKPSDLSLNFLREFMELPVSYYSPGAPIKYQDFVERWGTHYIKSAKFGGQLEIRKTMDKETAQSKTHFSKVMEAEYKSLFASVGAKSSVEKGFEAKSATQTTSTSVVAQGGSHEIASILSDVYSPTFKTEFKHWLTSIPSYPKPFKFRMGAITDLVNFRATDLFPEETVNWGCEGYVAALKSERNEDGELVKYYEISEGNEVKKKVYCPFDSRGGLEQAIRRRRSSLHRAIEVYMEEGIISISDFNLNCPEANAADESKPGPAPNPADTSNDEGDLKDLLSVKEVPKWNSMTTSKMPFKVVIDMKEDLKDSQHGVVVIPKNMARRIRFLDNRWFTDDEKKVVHLYNGFNNGGSGNPKNRKISVLGLVLSYEEKTGRLVLTDNDFKESKRIFPDLSSSMKGSIIGQVEADHGRAVRRRSKLVDGSSPAPAPAIKTCKIMFSNALRFDPTGGKCLHFTAITEGTIYVMFAVSPAKPESRYTVRIANDRVDIYKGSTGKVYTVDESAVGIGTKSVHQSYFVCVTEEPNKAVRIEYGKSPGSSDAGDVFLSFGDVPKDDHKVLSVRFYAFGIEDVPVKIMDAHLLMRKLTETSCKGETREDNPTGLCAEKCHIACDPTARCTGPADTECKACRLAKDTKSGSCLDHCPKNTFLTSEEVCQETFEIDGTGFPKGETEIDFDTDMPAISEFTISFWVKLFGWKDGALPAFYFRSDSSILNMGFATAVTGRNSIDYKVSAAYSAFYLELPEDVTMNPTWHFISTTWSKMTNVLVASIDGKQRSWNTAISISSGFSGGGRLGLAITGPLEIRLTSFNMWDHVLGDDVIEEHAKSCSGAIGNVKEWYDVWSVMKTKTNYVTKPSSCSAPPIKPIADLPSPGMSPFAKYKKRKSSIKDGSKTHH